MDRGLAVEGVVLDARDGSAVEGAKIAAEGTAGVLTDSDGRFRLAGLSGKTRLDIEHPRYRHAIVPEADPALGEPIEVRLDRGGSLEGTVFHGGSDPLPGAEISIRQQDASRAAITDAAGHYRIDGLPEGTFLITKSASPGSFQDIENAAVTIQDRKSVV